MTLAVSATEADISDALSCHLDHYNPSDIFVCLFCAFEDSNPLTLLTHLRTAHSLILTDLRHIPLLPKYLDYWRIHVLPIVPVSATDFVTIDPNHPEERQLRISLHFLRLDSVMRAHEAERTIPQRGIACLFCQELFDGTWHGYLQWLFETHQFNPGRPSNLVFIPELVERLRGELEVNVCMYCRAVFPNQRKLKSHMRKKKHMRIPADHEFDRFYVVNYQELDGRFDEDGDEEETEEMEELEKAAEGFDEIEVNETVCLVCDMVMMTPEEAVGHMRDLHRFDLAEVRRALKREFYDCVRFVNWSRWQKSEGRCFVCGMNVAGDYTAHIEGHERKIPEDFQAFRGNDQLLIPFFAEDPLLTELEADDDG
jgi:hypothetical protein